MTFRRRFFGSGTVLFGTAVIAVTHFVALLADVIAPYDHNRQCYNWAWSCNEELDARAAAADAMVGADEQAARLEEWRDI